MHFEYDKDNDILHIELSPKQSGDIFPFETDNFTVLMDLNEDVTDDEDDDDIVSISIRQASHVVAQMIAAGVDVGGAAGTPSPKQGMVWYEADSSMISSFGYDENQKILEVAFHKTGVYRYFEVPKDVFEGLRNSDSKGSYMRSLIIDQYFYEKSRGRR